MYPRISDLFLDLFGVTLPFPIYSFGALVAVAILTAAALLKRELDRKYQAGLLPAITVKADTKDRRGPSTVRVSPGVLTGTIAMIAAVAGVAGSKLFHILENLGEFARDPAGMLFSAGGLTFYGGLITAAVVIAWYVRRKGLAVPRVADATAPGLILAYGIGRIGCYLSGDGDWGICSDLAAKPAWLPTWLWSETFPRNILDRNVVADCLTQSPNRSLPGEYLPAADGVYPTMLYEFAMCALAFGLLWTLRKHPYRAGWLFGVYLMLTAVERFTIELIRVNNRFTFAGLEFSQAEFISVILFVVGAVIVVRTTKRVAPSDAAPVAAVPAS